MDERPSPHAGRDRGAALPDPRNAGIFIHVDGDLLPRDQAKVSVFDSSVQGGDASLLPARRLSPRRRGRGRP